MTVTRFLSLILAVAALALPACSPEDPFIPTQTNKPTVKNPAYMRVVHAAADAPAVDVLLDTSGFFEGRLEYLKFPAGINEARYYPTDTSASTVAFRSGGEILAEKDISLRKGGFYTTYLYGEGGDYHVLHTIDTLVPTPSVSQTRLRVVNMAPGAPPFSVLVGGTRIVSDVAYGTASNYVTSSAYPVGTSLRVLDDEGQSLFAVPKVPIPGGTVLTFLVTGKAHPRGDEPFLTLTAFFDNATTVTGTDTLFGSLPLRIEVAAVAFVNLVPTASSDLTLDSSLDVAFYDRNISDYADNEYFRRNYPGQPEALINVTPLGFINLGLTARSILPHLMLNASTQPDGTPRNYPYRIEVNRKDNNSLLGASPVLVPPSRTALGMDMRVAPGKRYTIVAFGPFVRGEAESAVLADNSPLPEGNMAGIRLFHGGFGELKDKKLRLRVDGADGPFMMYGEIPTADHSVSVPAGTDLTLELVDETGTVVYSEPHQTLEAGTAYTVFLSRGPFGDQTMLTPVTEAIRLQ